MLDKTLQITKYKTKKIPNLETIENILRDNGIVKIQPEEEVKVMFTDFDDPYNDKFNDIIINMYGDGLGDIIRFNFRLDIKKINKNILKHKFVKYCKANNIDIKNINKQRKNEIIENLYFNEVKITQPEIKSIEVLYQFNTQTIYFFNNNKKHNDFFVDFFNKAFDENIYPVIPFILAEEVFDENTISTIKPI